MGNNELKDKLLWGFFEPMFLAIIVIVLKIEKYVDEKYGPSIVVSDFWNWLYLVLIGLLVCVKGSEANGRLVASERGFGIQVREEYRRRCRIDIAAAAAAAAAAIASI